MDELQYDRLKKVARIGIILFIFISILLLGMLLTKTIIDSSYKTEDVLTKQIETTSAPNVETGDEKIGRYSVEEYNTFSNIEKTIVMMYEVPTDDLAEASLKKSIIILSCSDSPWCEYMASSKYTLGKVSKGYKIDFVINGEELSVICSQSDATPVIYIKDTEFTDEEVEFLDKLGVMEEVRLDDGTYSIQFF